MNLKAIASRHHILSAAALAVLFIPLLWISHYNFPNGDDYYALLRTHAMTPLNFAKWEYLN